MHLLAFIIFNIVIPLISGTNWHSNLQKSKMGQVIWENRVYKEGIKTVLIYKKGRELSLPLIELNSGDQVSLVFDGLGVTPDKYSYTIVHCNSDWEQSELEPIEYISGHQQNDITKYEFSQNTIINYVNYQLDFPNDNCNLLVSGNYIIKVFETNNPENLALTARFYVIETLATISANIEQLKIIKDEGVNQRLSFQIEYNENEIENPYETLSFKVFKTNEPEKDFKNLKPSSIHGNTLNYESLDALLFAGGNEYRHFDTKSFKFLSDCLEKIDKQTEGYHVFVKTDYSKAQNEYKFLNDINGRNTIKLESNDRSHIMADYCDVYFSLEVPLLLERGNYYLFGSLSNWSVNEKFRMEYNEKLNKYEKKLFLKQGYYNYMYLFHTDDELFIEGDKYRIEGNHFTTENEYNIFVYHKSINDNFDRLVGYANGNSLK